MQSQSLNGTGGMGLMPRGSPEATKAGFSPSTITAFTEKARKALSINTKATAGSEAFESKKGAM